MSEQNKPLSEVKFQRWLTFGNLLARNRDLIVVVLLFATVIMMVIPLPTVLVDLLLALNMMGTILLLMVALYLNNPLQLSTLPSIILIATMFRLSLSITTTRLILVQADAGAIIETFGQFVIAGNIVVGLVIFLIITVVQFIVITKGSERVAEVGARFTLDALPGKQMSIDADLRSGDITQDQARDRRQTLERESQFFGAMDGSMKFVKGDAIAGLIITMINLLGGVAIGVAQLGMPMEESMRVYSLLTIGDGLMAQLPALLVSVSAGIIITRVRALNDDSHLGSDIAGQFTSSPTSLRLAALVVFLMCFVPGFPAPIFIVLAIGLLVIGYKDKWHKLYKIISREKEEEVIEEVVEPTPIAKPIIIARSIDFSISISKECSPEFVAEFEAKQDQLLTQLTEYTGVIFKNLTPKMDKSLEVGDYRIDLEMIPLQVGHIPVGGIIVDCEYDELQAMGCTDSNELDDIPGYTNPCLVASEHEDILIDRDIYYENMAEAIARALVVTMQKNASQVVGMSEIEATLKNLEVEYPKLVDAVIETLPLQKITDVFIRLLSENISLRNSRAVLEALIEWGEKEKEPASLAEYIRIALKRQISYDNADSDGNIYAYLMDNTAEETIRSAVRHTEVGSYMALDDDKAQQLIAVARSAIKRPLDSSAMPIVLTSLDVRRFAKSFLEMSGIAVRVLSYHEIAPEFKIKPITRLSIQ